MGNIDYTTVEVPGCRKSLRRPDRQETGRSAANHEADLAEKIEEVIMADVLEEYKDVREALPSKIKRWHLHGAGLESLE